MSKHTALKLALFYVVGLSACSTIEVKTELPNNFAASSQAIEVDRPNWQFRDKFYNVRLGNYKVSNANISALKLSGKSQSLKKEKLSNTLYNLLFKGKLDIESTEFETIAKTQSRKFSFDVKFDEQNTFQSQCKQSHVVYTKKKTTNSIFSLNDKKKKNRNEAVQLGIEDWQHSNTVCTLRDQGQTWTLEILAFKDKVPLLTLRSVNKEYRLKPLYTMFSGSDYSRRVIVASDATQFEDTNLKMFGVAVMHNDRILTNVSLDDFNDPVIWLGNNLQKSEANFLLGVNHTLLMASWLDDFSY